MNSDFSAFTQGNFGKPAVLCRRCRRVLTDPISIDRKIGPECIKLAAVEAELEASDELDVELDGSRPAHRRGPFKEIINEIPEGLDEED